MRHTVTLPRLTAEADTYVVDAWTARIGDHVAPGDRLATLHPGPPASVRDARAEPLAVVSPVHGTLARRIALPGEVVHVGEPLAVLSDVAEPIALPPRAGAAHGPPPAPIGEDGNAAPGSAARRLLAEHDRRSWNISPHVTTAATVDLAEVERLRARIAPTLAAREGVALDLLPFLLSVTGAALAAHPALGRAGGPIAIGVPMAAARPDGGEIPAIPVVRLPHQKSIAALARECEDLARRARDGTLTPDEQRGATFTVLRPIPPPDRVLWQTAVLHRPQPALLSVGAVVRTPVALERDVIAVHPLLHLCLIHDARAVAGSKAASFLTAIVRGLEEAQFLFA